MLGRETRRDERQRDERGRSRDRLQEGSSLGVGVLAAVLLEAWRNKDVTLAEAADERATAAARRVRDHVSDDRQRVHPERDGWWTFDRFVPGHRVASDERFRKALLLAGAILAGLLLVRRRGSETSAEGASNGRGEAIDAAMQVRSRAPAGGTDNADAGDATGTTDADAIATGIQADVEDLSAPTTGGMPMLGVGTHRRADYDECFESVRQALRMGYRHVDAVDRRAGYYTEEAVGDAVDRSGLDRETVFVATKVTPADLDPDHVQTSVEESLDRLDTDYVDLLYVHWPTGEYEPRDTLDAFANLREEGLVDRIGVSNFTADLLEEALEVTDTPIFANQVEMHPLLPQTDLREFCERVGVEIVAYSPIARGDVEDVAALQEVAGKHGATPEQVSLAWLREKGVTAIPRATTEDHLRENWRSLALDLNDEDVAKLDAIEERRRIVDPDDAPWNS